MTRAIILAAIISTATVAAKAQIVINELMQSNIDCIMDDLNDFPDSWVELYNDSSEAVTISGWKLSLNADGSEAYTLPEASLSAHAYLLIYCDKVGDGFHADFRIDSGKGSLYLFDNTGLVVDALESIKKQPAPNIAYGRITDASTDWGYQLTPTPGASNAGGVSDTILGEPIFSQNGGVWNQTESICLELLLPDDAPENAIIRYTTDGKEPSLTEGCTYIDPITIDSSSVIRAKVIAEGCLSMPSTVNSYIFLEREQKIPVVSLAIDPTYLYDDAIGIFVEGYGGSDNPNYNYNWRRPLNLEYFPVDEDAALNQLCEMRVQGGYTRQSSDLKSMALYANKRFGTKRFEYEFWPDDKPGITDNKSFILRHGGNDMGWAYFRDALCQRMMGRYVDMDWQGYTPVIVYLNGQYLAMLGLRERSNEDNIYANYNGLEDIDMVENWWDIKEGTWDNFSSFSTFYGSAGGHTIDQWREWLNVEQFTDMMILASWVINDDFPHNNIVMWRPRADGGKWRWLLKDFDFGLGIWDTTEHKYNYNYFDWLYSNTYYDSTRLYRRLMLNDDYKKLYVDRWVAHTGDFLTADNVKTLLDEIIDENQGELAISDQKWGFSWHSLQSEWNAMHTWITNRSNILPSLLKSHFGLGSAVSVTINQDLTDDEADGLQLTYAGVPLHFPRFSGKDYRGRTLSLTADGGVSGWNVAVGNAAPEYHAGSSLEMLIDNIAAITINAVIGDVGVNTVTSGQLTKVHLDTATGIVYANGPLAVYDLQGRIIANARSSYQLPARGCYLINSQKILW